MNPMLDELTTVLIVDDEPAVQLLQRRHLERAGFLVCCASGPADALALLAKQHVDLIVLDHRLSESETGLDFMRRLRFEGHDLPVIVVTGYTQESTIIEALRSGVRDFVAKKPGYLDYLPQAVNRVLQRVRVEQDLARSEARLANIVSCAMDALLTIDAGAGITLFNAAAERVFGCPADTALGQPIGRFLPWCGTLDHLLTHPASRRFEIDAQRYDGSVFPAEISLWSPGDPSAPFVTLAVRDISDRQAAEAALRQKEELLRQAQKLEALGALSGGVAHEFNNVLQSILGYTTYALDSLPAQSTARDDLETALQAAHRAAGLTKQLLTFCRQQPVSRTLLNINELVHGVVKMLRPLLGASITINLELAPQVELLQADAGQLEQVLLNLCINARDAMPEGGTLTISTREVDSEAADGEDHSESGAARTLVLSVADTGCGMQPEIAARAFEPFFTTKSIGAGTGLGLSTVYGIVRQHHGRIDVDSSPGQGTTLHVRLPLHAEPLVAQPASSHEAPPGGRETILVADDEPQVRGLIVRALRGAGYAVLTASDGQEALDLYRQRQSQIDLCVFDVGMPRKSGAAALCELQREDPEFRAILCTGMEPEGFRERWPAAKARIVSKPYEPSTLLQAVREVLDERRACMAELIGAGVVT